MSYRLVKRYRARNRVLPFNPWNFDAEPGDLMVDSLDGTLWRLQESNGWGKRNAGELTPRRIHPPHYKLKAKLIRDGEAWTVWWVKQGEDVVMERGLE